MNDFSTIPEVMKNEAYWCVWKYDKHKSKLPFNAKTGRMAKSNDKTTFTDFQTAFACYEKGGYDGLGIGIFDGFCAIDIDHCIHNDKASEMAKDIFKEMNSYTEISPSGKGIRIIFKVQNFQYDKDKYYIMNNKLGLEIYISDITQKYVTITGNTLGGNDVIVAEDSLQKVLDNYMDRGFNIQPQFDTPSVTNDTTDYLRIGLQKDKKLIDYWNGHRNTEKSESQDDLAFISKLMYWCNNDETKVKQAFYASPYAEQKDEAHKKKMMREDYMKNTIKAARSERTAAQVNAGYFAKHHQPTTIEKREPIMTNKKDFKLLSAIELQQMDLPPVKYLVEDMLPEGTGILVAPPKIGKSWFVLDMGLSIAMGKNFLGKQTYTTGVLYFALEDSIKRLKDRMNKILGITTPPSNFYIQTKAPTMDNKEFLNLLKQYIEKYDIKLVIIDTLQKVRRQEQSPGTLYQRDYRDLGEIKQFADGHNLSVFFVHHTRKMKDEDPYNMISGTNGIMGAVDTAFVITKDKRSDKDAVMHITGRDIEQNDFVIHFNTLRYQWNIAGTLEEINMQEEKSQYESNPLVLTVLKLLKHSENQQWSGNSKKLIEEGKKMGITIPYTSTQVGKELERLSGSLFQHDKITYQSRPNGNAGKNHCFKKYELPDYTPQIDYTQQTDTTIYEYDDEEVIF